MRGYVGGHIRDLVYISTGSTAGRCCTEQHARTGGTYTAVQADGELVFIGQSFQSKRLKNASNAQTAEKK